MFHLSGNAKHEVMYEMHMGMNMGDWVFVGFDLFPWKGREKVRFWCINVNLCLIFHEIWAFEYQ